MYFLIWKLTAALSFGSVDTDPNFETVWSSSFELKAVKTYLAYWKTISLNLFFNEYIYIQKSYFCKILVVESVMAFFTSILIEISLKSVPESKVFKCQFGLEFKLKSKQTNKKLKITLNAMQIKHQQFL